MRALIDRTLGAVPPAALVLFGTVSVQTGSALAKQLFSSVGSLGTVAMRVFFAAVVLLLVWRPPLRMRRESWAVVLAYGVVLGLMNLCIYLALARIPLGIAVTIEFLGPLVVAMLGSRRRSDALWALLAGCGVLLLMDGSGRINIAGILFAIAAATFWGLYILLGTAIGRYTTNGDGLALGMAIAAIITVPFGLADSGSMLFQPWVLFLGLGVAILSSVVPYTCDLEALRRMPPRAFSVLMSLEPAVAALIGWMLLHESLRLSQWLAIGCVTVASAGVVLVNPKAGLSGPCEAT